MKKTLVRKLFLSIIACLFALTALGTTTFAWFSMNTTATVTGMQIEASAANGDLLIATKAGDTLAGDAPTIESIRALNVATVDLAAKYSVYKMKPVAHEAFAATSTITNVETFTNWYTMVAANKTESAGKEDSKANIEAFAGYVLEYDLYFAVNAGSIDMKDLKVDTCKITVGEGAKDALQKAVRVAVVSESAFEEFTYATNSTSADLGQVALVSSLTEADEAPAHVKVYVFIDGNAETIYTNNFLNLDKVSVELTFKAVEVK